MRIKVFSIIVSFVFIPIAALLQFVGHYIGLVTYWFVDKFSFWGLPKETVEWGPYFVGGLLAGYFSAFACKKIYKNFNFNYVIIAPSVIILISIIGSIIGSRSEIYLTLGRDILTILSFFYFLKNEN